MFDVTRRHFELRKIFNFMGQKIDQDILIREIYLTFIQTKIMNSFLNTDFLMSQCQKHFRSKTFLV